jgi:hypothetical protein
MIDAFIKYQKHKYTKQQVQSVQWYNEGKVLTDYGSMLEEVTSRKAITRTVEILERDHPFYRARVSLGDPSNNVQYVEVAVHLGNKRSVCPCKLSCEMGCIC